ncbi:MAG: phosphoribosylglycinamide formyltransferase [Candidatus Dormibacteria bacterium]
MTGRDRLRVAVIASGRGTNLDALARACRENTVRANVVLVISNRPSARALEVAARHGLPTVTLSQRDFASLEERDRAIAAALTEARADLLVNAGYDRWLTEPVLRLMEGRIINVHPSLLPAFAGTLSAVRDALAHGVRVTGVTVHFVDASEDQGPIILQEPIPVFPEDDEATLLDRLHTVEHRLLVEAVRLFAAGRLRIIGRTVQVLDAAVSEAAV